MMDSQSSFSVVASISAGWTPRGDDPLAEYTRGRSKALIPIAGKPMVAHVIEALAQSRYVRHIVIVALDPQELAAAGVELPVPVEYVPDAGGILANAEAGFNYAVERYPDADGVLICTSDVPLITGPIVDALIEECSRTEHEICYTVVERNVMEARFPTSRRSYVHLREGDFAGGDVHFVRAGLRLAKRDLWHRLTEARKNALRQARLVGLGLFVKLLFRRLSLTEAEQRVCRVLHINGRVIPFPYAEIGMDVDKPFQLEIARAELEARG